MDELEKDAGIYFVDEIGVKHPLPFLIENKLFDLM